MGNTTKNNPMKIKVKITLLLLLAIANVKAQSSQMDLTECLNYGMEHSPYMTIANNEMKMFEYNKREAYGLYLPQINGQVTSDYNAKLPVTVIPAGGFHPPKYVCEWEHRGRIVQRFNWSKKFTTKQQLSVSTVLKT